MNTHDLSTMNDAHDSNSSSADRRALRAWRCMARLGAAMALAGAALGCMGAESSDEAQGDSEMVLEAKDSLYAHPNWEWPASSNGITYIPVCWESSGYDSDKEYVRSVVEGHWAAISGVEFTGWGICDSSDGQEIRISHADGSGSTSWWEYSNGNVALYKGIDIELNFTYIQTNTSTCFNDHPYCNGVIALHEFGHALGYYHEQVRPENAGGVICNKWDSGETIETDGTELTDDYDTDSIMGYCSVWDRDTPVISDGDVEGMNAQYGSKPNNIDNNVLIYEGTHFQGKSQALWAGVSYNLSDLTIGNDTLSSIRIPSGYTATLYQNSNFGGTQKVLTAGDYVDLSDQSFNDAASSIVVSGTASTTSFPVIYKDAGYGGSSQTLRPGLYSNSGYLTIGNDTLSSLTVPSGWTVTLYTDTSFTGTAVSYTSNTSSLGSMNDKTTSIRVEGPASFSPVMVFKDASYKGSAQALWPGRYNKADLTIGTDAASSIIIPDGWTVWLMENEDFYGEMQQYTSSQSTLTGDSFNDKTSSIVVQGPES